MDSIRWYLGYFNVLKGSCGVLVGDMQHVADRNEVPTDTERPGSGTMGGGRHSPCFSASPVKVCLGMKGCK